jgi:hypothetical protein
MVLCVQQSVDVIGMLLLNGRNGTDVHVAVPVLTFLKRMANFTFFFISVDVDRF